MKTRAAEVQFDWTEALESERASVDLDYDVQAMVTPGEPMVRYYPDGSGYPGSPPEAEIFEAVCTMVSVTQPSTCPWSESPSYYQYRPGPKKADALGRAFLLRVDRANDWEPLEKAAFEAAERNQDEPEYQDDRC